MKDFVMGAWYMAAWSDEITEQLLSRKLLGRAILLTRDENGAAVAMRDRCPHRFAQLSMGKREGNNVRCGYHGLCFNLKGECVDNPYSDRIPKGASVRTFPVTERDDIIWVWFGDPQQADPSLIPDFSATVASPQGTRVAGCTPIRTNYEYVTDNLLDLSHIEFLHTGTFAGNGVIFAGTHSLEQKGEQLHSNWWMPGVKCPTMLDQLLQRDIVDHWLDMRWDAPGNMYLQVGATPPGEPREAGAFIHTAHILTPVNKDETLYFWSTNLNYPMPEEHVAGFRELVRAAFEIEDKPMIESSYENSDGDFWGNKPIFLGVDSGGPHARRIIERMKRAEAEWDQSTVAGRA